MMFQVNARMYCNDLFRQFESSLPLDSTMRHLWCDLYCLTRAVLAFHLYLVLNLDVIHSLELKDMRVHWVLPSRRLIFELFLLVNECYMMLRAGHSSWDLSQLIITWQRLLHNSTNTGLSAIVEESVESAVLYTLRNTHCNVMRRFH